MKKEQKSVVEESSGNIFADIGLPNADQEQLKARLTLQIYRTIKDRGLTQMQAADVLGLKQPHVSLLMRNRSGSFSVGKLLALLTKLDQDVQITVRPKRHSQAELSLVVK